MRQHGAVFRLDYGCVYWNSRLEHEHARVVGLLRPGEVLCDLMAGVGPFAVPAARRRVSVFANDLNPACAHYLAVNAVLNGVQPLLRAFNLDARAFLRALAGAGAAPGVAPAPFDVVVMNLPASAVEFLDAFAGAFGHPQWAGRPLPRVHCYAFLRDSETQDDLRRRAERALGGPVGHSWAVHVVRDVAPRKEMVCLSFTAPDWLRDPARATQARPDEAQEEGGGREGKRARVD